MEENVVDTRGMLCPQPLIMTKKALGDLATGRRLRILIDNETSRDNVVRFLTDNGLASSCREEKGLFTLIVTKTKEELPKDDAQAYHTVPAGKVGSHVMVISSDKMGNGADELGAILMKAFVNTIKEIKPLPAKIVFYNSGILLAAEGSALIDPLKELETMGVSILVCGTCVNYFQKQNLILAGTISNMYEIIETLSAASSVIRP